MLELYGILIFAGFCVLLLVWVHYQLAVPPKHPVPIGRNSATLDRPLVARRDDQVLKDSELEEFRGQFEIRAYHIAQLDLPDHFPRLGGVHQPELALNEAQPPCVLVLAAEFVDSCSGQTLYEIFRELGMELREDGLYKKFYNPGRVTLFYAANSDEPEGRFESEGRLFAQIRRVVFFTQFPLPVNELHAFNDMLKIAEEVCDQLGGELQDEKEVALTSERTEAMIAIAESYASVSLALTS